MPTDLYHTRTELEILFQEQIIAMLGYTKTGSPAAYSEAAYSAVRVSWPTVGAPAWKVADNIVFIRVVEDDDPYNRQREVEYTDVVGDFVLNEASSYTRIISLYLVIYGPSSFDNAQLIRDCFFRDVYRRELQQENLYPIPDMASPRRVPEPFQNQWWERTDFEIRFNEKIVKNISISAIESAEVIVYNRDGIVYDGTVTAD